MKAVYIGASDSQVKWGRNDDPRGVLTEGKEYEVINKEVHSWHTKFTLKEFPNFKFNSACFDTFESDDWYGATKE